MPAAGEVVETNSELGNNPGTVNESPVENGWFVKIKLSDQGKADCDALMDDAAYQKHCDEEEH